MSSSNDSTENTKNVNSKFVDKTNGNEWFKHYATKRWFDNYINLPFIKYIIAFPNFKRTNSFNLPNGCIIIVDKSAPASLCFDSNFGKTIKLNACLKPKSEQNFRNKNTYNDEEDEYEGDSYLKRDTFKSIKLSNKSLCKYRNDKISIVEEMELDNGKTRFHLVTESNHEPSVVELLKYIASKPKCTVEDVCVSKHFLDAINNSTEYSNTFTDDFIEMLPVYPDPNIDICFRSNINTIGSDSVTGDYIIYSGISVFDFDFKFSDNDNEERIIFGDGYNKYTYISIVNCFHSPLPDYSILSCAPGNTKIESQEPVYIEKKNRYLLPCDTPSEYSLFNWNRDLGGPNMIPCNKRWRTCFNNESYLTSNIFIQDNSDCIFEKYEYEVVLGLCYVKNNSIDYIPHNNNPSKLKEMDEEDMNVSRSVSKIKKSKTIKTNKKSKPKNKINLDD
jgi:hypothetical protein